MRGLIITNLYPNPNQPTRATFNFQQFEHLSRYCELLILVPVFPADWKHLSNNPDLKLSKNNNVHYLKVPTVPKFGKIINAKILYWAISIFKISLIRKFSPEFVLGCFAYPDGVAASKIASKLKLPCFMKVHGTDINVMGKVNAIKIQISRELKKICGVLSVSHALAKNVIALGCPEKNITVIYNGIDHTKFHPTDRESTRKKLGLDIETPIILFIGNILEAKGAVDLIHAFIASNIKAKLLYIGRGKADKEINQIAQNLNPGQSISIMEPQSHNLIPNWISACDVLALPSHNEGVPNVVLEAMACGRPVVATNVGGIPEILPSESGILVNKGDINALASALSEAIKTDWDILKIAQHAKQFDWNQNASQTFRYICGQISLENNN